jgi:asparagine synthase (glutamine-hydrolysing)
MNEEAIAQRFEQAVWHSEHQNYDLNFVGKYALSEAPQELGIKVRQNLIGVNLQESY